MGQNAVNAGDALRSTPADMASLIAAHDWAVTPLGAYDHWPANLKTVVDVILAAPLPMIVRWGPSLIQIYNDAYATLIHAKHPSALGMGTRECWPESWETYGPVYAAVFRGEVRSFQDQPSPQTHSGIAELAWFDVTFSPLRNERRLVEGVLLTVVESTRHMKQVLRAEAAEASRDRLASMFAQAPGFIAIMKGPQHTIEFANEAYLRLVGRNDVVGKKVRDVVPEIEGQGFFELMDKVYATGESYVGSGMPAKLARGPEGDLDRTFVDLIYQPMRGPDGQVEGIFIEGSEVTERVLAEERQAVLVDELNHRVKNTLSTVLAIAKLAGKSATNVADFNATFASRIAAMAKTHDLLTTRHWAPVRVRDVLKIELAPYDDAGGQVSLTCHDMEIAAPDAVSLSLIIHELLTNAAKHGALATPEGRLTITCERDGAGAAMTWIEEAGRPVESLIKPGFGTDLIARLARALGGGAEMAMHGAGMTARVTFSVLG